MNCSILTIGTELLMGQITNTNAAFLSRELNELGINVLYNFTVGDNPSRLKEIFTLAHSLTDIVITTGGLGPTQDDLSKEVIAESLSKKLLLHEPSFTRLQSFFDTTNRKMTDNNIKQAYLPESSIVLENDFGTAPGFLIEDNSKMIISLPGPPREMTNMYLQYVKPHLINKSTKVISSRILKFVGIGESQLESEIEDLVDNQTNPTLATYANNGELILRITASANSNEEAEGLIEPLVEEISKRLDSNIYSYNNESLEEIVGNLLIDNNITISLAESCTGGLLSSNLTSLPGISKVFDRCIVTYSNTAKIQELGVNEEVINKYGAVSKETAIEMCNGIRKVALTDIAVSITGIAGPTGDTPNKPVGLVYIGISVKNKTYCKEFKFNGDRYWIRKYATIHSLNFLREVLLKEYNI